MAKYVALCSSKGYAIGQKFLEWIETRLADLQDALMLAPEETIPNLTHYLLFQSVRGRLENARSESDLREAIDYMWGVALQIEDGNLSLAARKLRDAQQALADALENGASDEEIAKLMDELREAGATDIIAFKVECCRS